MNALDSQGQSDFVLFIAIKYFLQFHEFKNYCFLSSEPKTPVSFCIHMMIHVLELKSVVLWKCLIVHTNKCTWK